MDGPAPTSLGDRLVARVLRDPGDRRTVLRNDAVLAIGLMALSIGLGLLAQDGERLDALGWALLLTGQLPLFCRRVHPGAALLLTIVLIGPYHVLDYPHFAAVPGSLTVAYTFASLNRPVRTFLVGLLAIGATVGANLVSGTHGVTEIVRVSGWLVAVLIAGANVQVYRRYLAATVERAERAERTRAEEAARQVAEERLRIARDLHDLLAHSITLIGVRTAVASHLLSVDPDRLDRAALATALDEVAETCRAARIEVRTTLEVLRDGSTGGAEQGESDFGGPLPDLTALPELASAAGARLTVRTDSGAPIPATVAAATYRIVQEALTNAVRHAGDRATPEVTIETRDTTLHVSVTDNGDGPPPDGRPADGAGFGLIGMRERARSVGGTLTAGPRRPQGFGVTALLPLRRPGDPDPGDPDPGDPDVSERTAGVGP